MAAIQERRPEVEQGVAGYTESEYSHICRASEDDINRQLDTRKAKFHPQKGDIVSAGYTSSSVADKVIQVIACDCGTQRAEDAHPEGSMTPIEDFEAVSIEADRRKNYHAEEEQHNWGSDRSEEQQHTRRSEVHPKDGTRAAVESCEAVLAEDEPSDCRGVHGALEKARQEKSRALDSGEEEDSRAIGQFPELESNEESFRPHEEAQQDGKQYSVETMSQAPGTQDESCRHSNFDQIQEKFRENDEQSHLKGDKGIEDDPHSELAFVRQEPNFEYNVSTEVGGVDSQNTAEKPEEKLNVKHQSNADNVLDEEQEFSDAAPSFHPTQETISDEKEFVDAPISFEQLQESNKGELMPIQHTAQIHERVVYDVTPPAEQVDCSSTSVQRTTGNDSGDNSLTDSMEPSKDDVHRTLEREGSPSSSDEEDSSSDVDEEFKPGFFSKMKQTLWKSGIKTENGHKNEDDGQLDTQGLSAASSFEKEHLPTSQPAQMKKTDDQASYDIASPTVEDDAKPGFFSKVKQTIWKTESKKPYAEDDDMTQFDNEDLPSSASSDEVAKPGFFGKVKQSLWKTEDTGKLNAEVGNRSTDKADLSTDLEHKGSSASFSSHEEVAVESASIALPDKQIDKDTSFAPTEGGETSVISSLSQTWDVDNVETPAYVTDTERTQQVVKDLKKNLTLDEDDDNPEQDEEGLSASKDQENHLEQVLRKVEGPLSMGEKEESRFLGPIATEIGFSTSPTNHGRSQST